LPAFFSLLGCGAKHAAECLTIAQGQGKGHSAEKGKIVLYDFSSPAGGSGKNRIAATAFV